MVDPYRREAWRAEARARRAESRGGVSDRWSGVFKHSWHSVWLLWHLNSVWCLKHLSTPRMDKCKWQNGREGLGLHFYKNITRSEKYPNINCTETGKGAASQLWGTGSVIRGSGSQIRGAGSEIRRDPPNLTPAWNCIDKHCSGANLNLFCSHRRTAENYIRTILCALMQSTCSGHDRRNWEKFHLVELNILIKISSKQPKSSLLLTFRPLSEAFIRRSWY